MDDFERKLDRARYVLLNWINVPSEYFHCHDAELCRATSPLKIRQAKDNAISILKKMKEEYATELDCIEKEELEFYIGNIEAAYERYKGLLIRAL